MCPADTTGRGWTPRELGKVLRVSADKIRGWIRSGELPALNLAPTRTAKPQFRILPHHLAEFERRRQVSPQAKTAPRRKHKSGMVDFYPDGKGGDDQ